MISPSSTPPLTPNLLWADLPCCIALDSLPDQEKQRKPLQSPDPSDGTTITSPEHRSDQINRWKNDAVRRLPG